MAMRNAALVPRMRSAFLKLPRPSSMEARGAPPAPISEAKAVTANRIGKQMNIRSMIVYEAFAACATMVGTDMVRARRPSPASIVFACTKDQLCQ